MIAAANGHTAVCRALAEAGCDLDIKDGDGNRASDLATDSACRELLLSEERKREVLWGAVLGKPVAPDPEAALRAMLASATACGLSKESPF
eukprot:6020310-Prymnesium_polylepis.1